MGRNGVKVIIRTRPTASFATHQLQIDPDDSTIKVFSGTAAPAAAGGGSPSKTDGGPSNRKDCWQFKFHQVLHNVGQDRVYEAIARDIVHGSVVDGVNGTILAYGQTGAGKSFTMIGDTRNYQHRGIAPRAIAQLFEEVENRIELQYTIRVSYMEIYNDRIYDLLEGQPGGDRSNGAAGSGNGELVVVEDARGTYVRGLAQVEVRSEQEALDQLFNGELQRTVAEHQLNKRSNRSHCILTFHIAQKSRTGGTERVTLSKLHLVDLAGSERLKKTLYGEPMGSPTKNLSPAKASLEMSTIKKESMYINQSLSFLEQCIVALGSKEPRHIPYRQTKLTNVLKDSLGGNSNTLMFACIWGEGRHLEETISTLKLAQRMMRVQNEVATIVETDPTLLLRKYERQIRELKHELVMHDALVERTAVVYDEHTPEQKHQLLQMVRRYVDAPTQELEDEALRLTSVHEIRELFRQFKVLFKSTAMDAMSGGAVPGVHRAGSNAGFANSKPPVRSGSASSSSSRTQTATGSRDDLDQQTGHSEVLVGDEEPGAVGFALGLVPAAARPTTVDMGRKKNYPPSESGGGGTSPSGNGQRSPTTLRSPSRDELQKASDNNEEDRGEEGEYYGDGKNKSDDGGSNLPQDAKTRAKNGAFQFYRTSGPGRKLHQSLQSEKDKLFEVKQRVKQITRRVNAVKEQIDTVRAQLEDKRNQRGTNDISSGSRKSGAKQVQEREEVVDEEEFIMMTAEREAKREYRSLFGELKDGKAELEFSLRSVELLRRRLVREFEDWFDEEGHALSKSSGTRAFDEFTGSSFSKEDKLDDGEKFDQMEVERIRAQDPDSLAFFQAQKKMRQQMGSASQRKAKR
ncbi:Kinesin-like protein kif9 [Phytophthora boehmeriae]|uniref:Kinesin-like protein n=1 Tax=Phytophthora boehmeriae TaxID=109152 RepID=A0A8T1WM78_9STRA|nr:Kinesin-like protein kif9 [Phytophthora boehmeriae]